MQLAQQIKMRQSQSLVMTPQLQQAIKLLQMTNIELCQFLDSQTIENPFLENTKLPVNETEKKDNYTESILSSTTDLSKDFSSGKSLQEDPSVAEPAPGDADGPQRARRGPLGVHGPEGPEALDAARHDPARAHGQEGWVREDHQDVGPTPATRMREWALEAAEILPKGARGLLRSVPGYSLD